MACDALYEEKENAAYLPNTLALRLRAVSSTKAENASLYLLSRRPGARPHGGAPAASFTAGHTRVNFTIQRLGAGLASTRARIDDLNEAAHARLTPNLRCRWKVLMEELLHANSLSNLYLVRSRSRRTVDRCTRAR